MDFIPPNSPFDYSMPDWDTPEDEKGEEYALRYLRFITTFYNQPSPAWNSDSDIENYSPIERGIYNSLYYIGKQRNINYNHITQDTDGNVLPVKWVKTKMVKPLIDRLCGDLIKQLGGKEISARSLSKRAKSERMKQFEDVMIQFDTRIVKKLDEIEAKFGVRPVFPLADKYNSQQEAEEALRSFKDDLEEVAVELGRYFEWINDFDTTLIECFKNDYCPANYMGVYFYVESGRLKSKRVPFHNLIPDTRCDDPFFKEAQFVGVIERMNIQSILKRFPNLSDAKKNELKEMQVNDTFCSSFFDFYNRNGNTWWTKNNNGIEGVVLTGYWICQRDTGVTKIKDSRGKKKYAKTRKEDGEKSEIVYDLYKATMVGNAFLVDAGYDTNVVRSIINKSDPELPVKILTGNTIMGDGVSPIGLVRDLVDLMDALDFKIREMMGKHKGKGYWVNGNKLVGASKEFIQQLSTMGIVVGYPSGEASPADNQPPIYPIDMTLDDSIIKYSNYYNELNLRAQTYLNLNPSTLGLQNSAVGLGIQKNNISMSSIGNMELYRNLFWFNKICLQYQVNLAKVAFANGEAEEEIKSMIVGERGLKVLDIIKKYKLEDVLIDISPKDVLTDDIKARILGMMERFAQAGQIDPLLYIRAEMAETLTQVESDFEKAFKDKLKREDAAMQADREAKAEAIALNNDGQLKTVNTIEANKKDMNTQNAITKVAVKDMELTSKEK